MDLISYGAVSTDFKIIATLNKLNSKIEAGEFQEHRLDCYKFYEYSDKLNDALKDKFRNRGLIPYISAEVFKPTKNYPAHCDEGGTSYFIPLEEGCFSIENVNYPIVPFVLYAFEDSKLHNTDFSAIMLK